MNPQSPVKSKLELKAAVKRDLSLPKKNSVSFDSNQSKGKGKVPPKETRSKTEEKTNIAKLVE